MGMVGRKGRGSGGRALGGNQDVWVEVLPALLIIVIVIINFTVPVLLYELPHFLPHPHDVGNYSHFIDTETDQGFRRRCSDSRPHCDLVDALHSWT